MEYLQDQHHQEDNVPQWCKWKCTNFSQISVLGTGTIANIYLDHQIYNENGQNSFQAIYNDGGTYNHNCVITQTGPFYQINNIGPCTPA